MVDHVSGRILLCADTDEVEKFMLGILPCYNDKAIILLSTILSIACSREKDHENRAKLKRALEVIECEMDVSFNTVNYEVPSLSVAQH